MPWNIHTFQIKAFKDTKHFQLNASKDSQLNLFTNHVKLQLLRHKTFTATKHTNSNAFDDTKNLQ